MLVALAAMMSPALVSAQTPDALKVQTFTLSNGMEVWINEDHSQPVAFGAVVVKAGAKDCPETGIAHYFEHMMFKGTESIGTIDYESEKVYLDSISMKYDELAATTDDSVRTLIQMDINRLNIKASDYAIPNEFNNLISECGGSALNAYTSPDITVYHNEFVSSYFEQWAELNSERLIDPVFRLFQSELETVYEEKNRSDNQMLSAFSDCILKDGFNGSPYQYPVIGTTANLKNPQLSKMAEFFRKYYVADNMGIMLTGDVNVEQALPVLEKTFGRIRNGEPNRFSMPELPAFNGRQEVIALAKVPVVKINAICFRAPSQKDDDCLPLSLMAYLLNNAEGTGLLDKLTTDKKLLMAMCMYPDLAFNEAGLFPILVLPKILFQSNKKAEEKVMAVIDDLKSGNFDDDFFESCKLSYKRQLISGLESKEERMDGMINAFAQGRSWDDVVAEVETVGKLTKADIVAMANKYMGENYLVIRKKFGDPEKDHLQKPPYKSVVPANRAAVSAYAQAVKESAEAVSYPQPYVDFENDAKKIDVAPNVTLYGVENPVNDIFNIRLIYPVGTIARPELERVAEYISLLGTGQMSYDDHRMALQKIGGSIGFGVDNDDFTISITGFDGNFEQTIALAADLVCNPQSDKKKLGIIRESDQTNRIMAKRDAATLSDALKQYVISREQSSYIVDKGKISDDVLMAAYDAVRSNACFISYSGTVDPELVASILKDKMQLDKSVIPFNGYPERQVVIGDAPTVYFVQKSKATQSDINALVPAGILADLTSRQIASAYGNYLGGGMGSLLFQEIREFRSYAYSSSAGFNRPDYDKRDVIPTYLFAYTGTQGDKTLDVMSIMDSLISGTPFHEERIERNSKEITFELIASVSSFRTIADYIIYERNIGYATDPSIDFFENLKNADAAALSDFWKGSIAGKPIIWTIVGDRKQFDLEELGRRYGGVTELKPKDIIKN